MGMSNNVAHLPTRGDEGSSRQIIADNLAAELARRRISGRRAARELDVAQMYVARRVSGEVELSATDVVRFAEMLGISPLVLLSGAGTDEPTPGNDSAPGGTRTPDLLGESSGYLAPVIPLRRAS